MRLSGTKTGSINQYRGLGDQLWDLGGSRPSLDLNFAQSKSLVDATTGSNLVDFTRASSGTYVGSDGLIKTAVTNLFTHSQEFNNATSWTIRNTSTGLLPVVTANVAIAPDGTLTADRIVFNLSGAGRSDIYHNAFSASGVQNTTSIWLKSATGTNQTIYLRTQGNVVTVTVTPTWQRFSGGGTTSDQFQLGLRDIYTGPVTSADIYAWGAQLEQSTTVGEYVKTTSTINSAPRFDHDPTTGESLGLLVEESRTNLLLQSEDFSTTWTLDTGNPTVSINAALSPNGTITADKLVEGITNGGQDVLQVVSIPNTGQYTYSVYAKAAERFKILLRESTSTGAAALYDLNTGSVLISGGGGTPSPSASIQSLANGWYRCQLTMSQGSTGNKTFRVFVVDDAETTLAGSYANRTGDGTSGVYLWGAQIEEGSFSTSYIPTEGSTVTRAADVASISGSNYSGWFNAAQGTLYADVIPLMSSSLAGQRAIAVLSDGTYSNSISMAKSSGAGTYRSDIYSGGSSQAGITGSSYAVGQASRLAFGYASNDANMADNGQLGVQDNTVNLPTGLNRLDLRDQTGASLGHPTVIVKRLAFFPQRLPNETLQTITQ